MDNFTSLESAYLAERCEMLECENEIVRGENRALKREVNRLQEELDNLYMLERGDSDSDLKGLAEHINKT